MSLFSGIEISAEESCEYPTIYTDCWTPSPSACLGTFFIRGDLLYLKPYESQLDECGSFEIDELVNQQSQVHTTTTNSCKDPAFNWDLGYRVGAGMEAINSCWDLGLYWMHYQTKTHRGWQRNCLNWTLNFDLVDLLIGRSYCFGEASLRLYGGLRGTQIREHVRAHMINSVNSFGSLIDIDDSGDYHQKLQAGGFLLGIEGEYPLCYGFGLYANAAISALYGQFRLKSDHLSSSSLGQSANDSQKHFNTCTNVIDLIIGLRWSTCLTDRFRLTQQISWEHHCFFDYNQIGRSGNLSLDGVGYFASIEF